MTTIEALQGHIARLEKGHQLTINELVNKVQFLERLNEERKSLVKNLQQREIVYGNAFLELRQREHEYRTLLENTYDIIARFDQNQHFLYINPVIEKYTFLPASHYIGKTMEEAGFYENFCQLWASQLDLVYTTRQDRLIESDYIDPYGKSYYYQARLIPEFANDGTVATVLAALHDVTAHRLTEEALRASKEKMRAIISAIPDLLFQMDSQGTYLDVMGNSTQDLYMPSPCLIGHDVSEILPFDISVKTKQNIKQALSTGTAQVFEYQLTINNKPQYFEARITPFGTDQVLGLVRNITDRVLIFKEIARLDRLNLVGEMAASIGHEIRNPMTTVRGFLQMLGRRKDHTAEKEYYDLMIDELDRANTIITEFLALAKNKMIVLNPHNLNTIIRTLHPLMEAGANANSQFIKLNLGELTDILCDEKEIRQLILNLVRNGLEAMDSGRSLTISTVKDNESVILSIHDEGKGIPHHILDVVGTPFVTTKDTGTGLGLAVCYSIAARHNAQISFETTPKGTVFLVIFRSETP